MQASANETSLAPLRDPIADAAAGLVWLILLNKPFYPFYVWWITGHGLGPAFLCCLSVPFFASLLVLRRRDPLWLLAGLPLVGILDTAFETKLLGEASGAALFFVPCALLTALLVPRRAYRLSWGLSGLLLALAVGLRGSYGQALYLWREAELAGLFSLNLVSAACLSFFILIRFAQIKTA